MKATSAVTTMIIVTALRLRDFADGLIRIKESIVTAFPETEYQRCIVHQVRNTLKRVAERDKKTFANDLKTIYHAPDEAVGYEQMHIVAEKGPNAMKRWEAFWDSLTSMFKFSADVRKVCIQQMR